VEFLICQTGLTIPVSLAKAQTLRVRELILRRVRSAITNGRLLPLLRADLRSRGKQKFPAVPLQRPLEA